VDEVYTVLRRFRVPAGRYHGRMRAGERDREQVRFMRRGRRSVMVATSAFGLGIDKPDIRYVLHFQAPASLEQYVQEAGRAGRDGRRANCLLLFDPADRAVHELLLARSRVRPEQLYRLGSALAAWAGEKRSPSLEALALSAELGPRITAALLAKVEEAGLVRREGSQIEIAEGASSVESSTRRLATQFERLRTQDARRLDVVAAYARADACRAVFLRGYFGEEAGEPCGLCDVCLGRAERPASFFEPLRAPRPLRRPRKQRPRRKKRRPSRSRRGGRRTRRRSPAES
jgi:ATP-dependent DNA helicase RecQ